LSLEEVLKFTRIEDLLESFIDRRVSGLSYQGFGEIKEWCNKRGIPVTVSDAETSKVVDFIATRNVIAHNRGVVDERYVRSVHDTVFRRGELRKLEHGDVWSCAFALTDTVIRTDAAVAEKFGLKRATFAPSLVAAGVLEPSGDDDPSRNASSQSLASRERRGESGDM
jgi:hypothetical protein